MKIVFNIVQMMVMAMGIKPNLAETGSDKKYSRLGKKNCKYSIM